MKASEIDREEVIKIIDELTEKYGGMPTSKEDNDIMIEEAMMIYARRKNLMSPREPLP